MASAPPGPEDEAHGDQAVDQTRIRVVQSQDDLAGQRREEAIKLHEDRSKAVIAKAISEATEVVEKASAEAQSFCAKVREGSDGTLSSRMNSPIERLEKSTEAILCTPQRGTSHRGSEANMLQGIMHSASESGSDDDDEERGTRMRPRSPRPGTNRKDPVETRRDGRTCVSWSPS